MFRIIVLIIISLVSVRAGELAIVEYGKFPRFSFGEKSKYPKLGEVSVSRLPCPFSDLRLRPLGMPTPEGRIIELTLNNPGQTRIILVGTVHTVPLWCYMPYEVANNIVR